MQEVKTTSLKINPKIYQKFKVRCIQRKLQYSEGMNQALEMWTKGEKC